MQIYIILCINGYLFQVGFFSIEKKRWCNSRVMHTSDNVVKTQAGRSVHISQTHLFIDSSARDAHTQTHRSDLSIDGSTRGVITTRARECRRFVMTAVVAAIPIVDPSCFSTTNPKIYGYCRRKIDVSNLHWQFKPEYAVVRSRKDATESRFSMWILNVDNGDLCTIEIC